MSTEFGDRGNLATRKMVYRILDQYNDDDWFVGLVESLGKRADDTDAILRHLLFGRFLETAENFELDRIGKILKTPRPYEQDDDIVFTFKSIGDPNEQNKGFGTVSDPSVGGIYTSVNGLTTDTLVDDETYRELLRARAAVLTIGPAIPDFYTWVTESFDIDVDLAVPSVGTIAVQVTSGSINQRIKNIIETGGPQLPGIAVIVTSWGA